MAETYYSVFPSELMSWWWYINYEIFYQHSKFSHVWRTCSVGGDQEYGSVRAWSISRQDSSGLLLCLLLAVDMGLGHVCGFSADYKRDGKGGISSLSFQENWLESLFVLSRAVIDQACVEKSIRRSRRVWDSPLRLLKLRDIVRSSMSHTCKFCQWHRSSVQDMQVSPWIRVDSSGIRVASDLYRSTQRLRCILQERISCDFCPGSKKLRVRRDMSRFRKRMSHPLACPICVPDRVRFLVSILWRYRVVIILTRWCLLFRRTKKHYTIKMMIILSETMRFFYGIDIHTSKAKKYLYGNSNKIMQLLNDMQWKLRHDNQALWVVLKCLLPFWRWQSYESLLWSAHRMIVGMMILFFSIFLTSYEFRRNTHQTIFRIIDHHEFCT